jgi:hypothetical protein
MKSDLYTKAILTVIAISLSLIAIEMTTKTANAQAYNAQSRVQLVAICNPDGKSCADINSDFQLRVTGR